MITPLLRVQVPALWTRPSPALTQAQADLAAQDRHGRWTALDALPQAARERIDSDISQLTEQLAPIAQILEPRRDT